MDFQKNVMKDFAVCMRVYRNKTSTSVEVEYMKMEERERLVKEEAIERGLREGRIRGREEGR